MSATTDFSGGVQGAYFRCTREKCPTVIRRFYPAGYTDELGRGVAYIRICPPARSYVKGDDSYRLIIRPYRMHVVQNAAHCYSYSVVSLSVCVPPLVTSVIPTKTAKPIEAPFPCVWLLPPPRSNAITSRLRSSQILPKVYTRTKRYCSFIQYGLNQYQ